MNDKKESLNNYDIENTLVYLQIISAIPKYGKLFFRNGNVNVDTYSNIQIFTRWYYGDSRDKTIEFIRNVYESTEYLIDYDIKYKEQVRRKIEKIVIGLNNLKETYRFDILTCERINYFIECFQNLFK